MDYLKKFDEKTKKNILVYLNNNYDEEIKKETKELLKDTKTAQNCFYKKLSFGTGGIRGIMGVGSNRINIYTIRTAALGLANYLKKKNKKLSVLIGYDNRKNSKIFALECAKVLANKGIISLIFEHLCPTPIISFGVRFKNCDAGIMITASHNPPEYNGFKVYGSDGGQVIFPEDKIITEEIDKIDDPFSIEVTNLENPLIQSIGAEIIEAYLTRLKEVQSLKEKSSLNIIYTSLHGTGIKVIPKALKDWGFENLSLVEKQCIEDENFTYAKTPNPENISALKMGTDLLKEKRADLLLATDPDADRLAVVVNHNRDVVVLSGNQIAVILVEYILSNLSSRNLLKENSGFVKTIVTSELFCKIVKTYNKKCFEVLTGFKYIAALIKEWEQHNSFKFIFGAEESLGFLIGDFVRDKDSISAACMICEIASRKKEKGKTLIDYLNEIFKKYGLFKEALISIDFEEGIHGMTKMDTIMSFFRNNPPKTIFGLDLLQIEDYKQREMIDLKKNIKNALFLPSSDVLRFWLSDHSKIVIRPSGTEPKMKIYISVQDENFSNFQIASDNLDKKINGFEEELKRIINFNFLKK